MNILFYCNVLNKKRNCEITSVILTETTVIVLQFYYCHTDKSPIKLLKAIFIVLKSEILNDFTICSKLEFEKIHNKN